jgi:hypothetical protein
MDPAVPSKEKWRSEGRNMRNRLATSISKGKKNKKINKWGEKEKRSYLNSWRRPLEWKWESGERKQTAVSERNWRQAKYTTREKERVCDGIKKWANNISTNAQSDIHGKKLKYSRERDWE